MSKTKFTKKEKSWILYDWANSVYATNIMAAIFPIFFVNIAGDVGDKWWGYGTSIATFLIAVMAPLLGAIADYKGMKKKLFTFFLILGVVLTASMAFVGSWKLMLIGYIISRIGFSGSNLFYDSFLTDVTTEERMDKISAWGYAMGYIGGSTIPFIISIVMLQVLGGENGVKFAILITSVWWAVFSIPMLKNVRQEHYIDTPPRQLVLNAFKNIGKTAKDIFLRKGLLVFVIAYFFYIDGVNTVISMSTAYGATLGLGQIGMILALLVTQIVAMPCSILFSRLAAKISTIKVIGGAIAVYLLICIVGFYMGFSLEPHQFKYEESYQTAVQKEADAQLANAGVNTTVKERFTQTISAVIEKGKSKLAPDTRTKDITELINEEKEKQVKTLSDSDAAQYKTMIAAVSDKTAAFLNENSSLQTEYLEAVARAAILFWCMALLVGTVQGGIQAMSRSYFGKLIPPERSNEFYGFFDIFGKFAAFIGPALYATITAMTGRSSLGILSLIVLFAAGGFTLIIGRKALSTTAKVNSEPTGKN